MEHSSHAAHAPCPARLDGSRGTATLHMLCPLRMGHHTSSHRIRACGSSSAHTGSGTQPCTQTPTSHCPKQSSASRAM